MSHLRRQRARTSGHEARQFEPEIRQDKTQRLLRKEWPKSNEVLELSMHGWGGSVMLGEDRHRHVLPGQHAT